MTFRNLTAVATFLVAAVAWAADSPTLIGNWPLAADAQDASGNGRHGALKGGAAFSAEDKALILDGADSYVSFGQVPVSASFTIALWVCPDWPEGDRPMRVLGKYRLQDEKILAIFADGKGRVWCYLSEDGAEDGLRSILKATSQSVLVESGRWRFLVVRWDSAKAAEGLAVLVDGRPVPVVSASDADISRLSTKNVDLTLGTYDIQTVTEDGVTKEVVKNPFRGMMSGLTIWDGTLSDEEAAGLFAAGRTPGPAAGTEVPSVAAPAADTARPLAAEAIAADGQDDYDALFAAKQQVFSRLLAVLAGSGTLDATDILRTAGLLAQDLDADQRAELARAAARRFAGNAAVVGELTTPELEALAGALWKLDPPVAREFLEAFFSDDTLWKPRAASTLATLAMLAGKSPDSREATESVVPAKTMDRLDARWAAEPGLQAADLANIALAWGGAWDSAKARAWALRHYQALLGTESARKSATMATLRRVAEVFRDSRCWGSGNEYPEFLSTLAGLIESGAELGTGDADLLALLVQTGAAKAELRAIVEKREDARGLSAAKVLAAAHQRSNTLQLWWKELETASGQGRRVSTYKRLLMGIVDGRRVAGGNPMRRLWHVEKAWKEESGDDGRYASLGEYADLWRHNGRPDVAFERVMTSVGTFDGKRSDALQALAGELDAEARKRARDGLRIQKFTERLKQKGPPASRPPPPVAAPVAGKGVAE